MYIEETNSTNTWIANYAEEKDEKFLWVRTDFQSAGRGQQGNSWESEKGKNLLFSFLLKEPDIPVHEPFTLSMRISVAIAEAIEKRIPDAQLLTIKWPNDIYYENRKLAGILIENSLCGKRFQHSIIGVGLNVNQTVFKSNAPNPTSLAIITGQTFDLEEIIKNIILSFQQLSTLPYEDLKQKYLSRLYRKEGFYPYVEQETNTLPAMPLWSKPEDGKVLELKIEDVSPQGELIVRDKLGIRKAYHFKQIKYLIEI